MTLMITILETLNAYDAGRIGSAIHAFGNSITWTDDLGAYCFLLLTDAHVEETFVYFLDSGKVFTFGIGLDKL